MTLVIKRQADQRAKKCIMHRVADISGGVTVSVADLVPGSTVLEGTPIAPGVNGLWHVIKTARLVTAATASATSYEVAKDSNIKVGDILYSGAAGAKAVTAVNSTNAAKDVITLSATLGAALPIGSKLVQAAAASDTEPIYDAKAICGSNHTVEAEDNLFMDAWVIAVVTEVASPVVDDLIKESLKGVIYV